VAEEQAVYIPVSGKQLGLVLVALVTALGSYPLANWFNPNLGHDAFTRSDGDKLEDRIESLEVGLSDCQRNAYMHREKQAETVATIKAKTLSNEYLIKQCMKSTRQ
jgi:hypothetical protein